MQCDEGIRWKGCHRIGNPVVVRKLDFENIPIKLLHDCAYLADDESVFWNSDLQGDRS